MEGGTLPDTLDSIVAPPFYDGQIFDAYAQIVGLIKQARRSIALIDNYIDETTLTMFSKRDAGKKLFSYIKMQETSATALMSGRR